jgi:hypothetical protein
MTCVLKGVHHITIYVLNSIYHITSYEADVHHKRFWKVLEIGDVEL